MGNLNFKRKGRIGTPPCNRDVFAAPARQHPPNGLAAASAESLRAGMLAPRAPKSTLRRRPRRALDCRHLGRHRPGIAPAGAAPARRHRADASADSLRAGMLAPRGHTLTLRKRPRRKRWGRSRHQSGITPVCAAPAREHAPDDRAAASTERIRASGPKFTLRKRPRRGPEHERGCGVGGGGGKNLTLFVG